MAEKKNPLPEVKNDGGPTIVEMVKEQQLSNFFLEQIRDILLKGFNLDKKSYEEAKKSFIKQKFRRAEGDDEGNSDPTPPKRKSITERAGDAIKKFDPGLLTKLLGAGAFLFLLDNPGAIDYIVDGATRLIDFFKGMISGIQSIYDAIVPYIPEFLTSNESVNKFVSDMFTEMSPVVVALGAGLIFYRKRTMQFLRGIFSIIGKTLSTAMGLFRKTETDLTKKTKRTKFGFGKRFGKLAGLIGIGIAGVTAAIFSKAESDVNKATSDMDTRAKNTERVKNLSPEQKKLMTDAGYKVSDTGAVTDASGRNVKATEAAAALDNAEKGKVVTPRSSLTPSSAPAVPAPAVSAAPAPAVSAAPAPAPTPAAASPSSMKPAASAATAVAANDNAIKTVSQSKSVVKSVGKVIGKFGVKAIPIVGAAAGGLFALKNLYEGDFVGASAEGAGIFLPTLAGAPLDLGIAAREVYNDAYQRPDNKFPLEEDLIQDPQMVGDRMEEIYREIEKQLPTNKENAKPRGRMKRAQQLRSQSQASQADAQVDSASSMEPGGPSASFAQVDSASSMEPSRPSASFQGPANENVEGQIIDAVSRTNVNQVTAPITVNNINNSTDASTSVKNENISGGPIDPINRDTSLYIGAIA